MIERKVIYNATQEQFVQDVLTKQIADKMKSNYMELSGRTVSEPEFNSWDKSTGEVKDLLELSGLGDLHVSFEYQLPYNQERIDCFLFGKNRSGDAQVVLIELKQWQKVEATDINGNFVETYVGGGVRRVPHPSQQVEGYYNYLSGFVEIFEETDFGLFGCAYCHNYHKKPGEGLLDPHYSGCIEKYPIYTREDVVNLANRLKELLSEGSGFEVFNRFMQSPIRPSKKLLQSVSKILENADDFSLLNEQILARNAILHKIKRAEKNNEKSVIIVKGGPGTGKTVIAIHILAKIASEKKKKTIFFSSKSKPLLSAIQHLVGKESKLLFTNLNSFVPSRVDENQVDILIVDEAHRIGKTSNSQFTSSQHRTDMPQIEQLVRCAKTSIFFIDDHQNIRGVEVGSTTLVRETAKKLNCSIVEEELFSQFRCNGSDNYLDWVESVLGHGKNNRILKPQDNFDFKIFDSPTALYEEILKKNTEKDNSARLVAGFCWPWSSTLDSSGHLVNDVKIGDFEMPWETHDKIRPPAGYVKWFEWAYKPEGIKQVGCIYTAQGFEFDYVGVIIGPDLSYDSKLDSLVGNIGTNKDPVLKRDKLNFDKYVKNIYRVLLTRGMKGCYVYFVDKETRRYFEMQILKKNKEDPNTRGRF